jgi:hypothetical protein
MAKEFKTRDEPGRALVENRASVHSASAIGARLGARLGFSDWKNACTLMAQRHIVMPRH